MIEIIHYSHEEFPYSKITLFRWFSSINPFKIKSPRIMQVPEGWISWPCEFLSSCWLWYLIKISLFSNHTCSGCCFRFILTAGCLRILPLLLEFHLNQTIALTPCLSGSLGGGFEFILTSCHITWIFFLVKLSTVLESLAMIMQFNLHSSFRRFVWFFVPSQWFWCFNDSILKVFSSVLIFSLIIFIKSEIILILKFTKFASFSILSRTNSFSSSIDDYRWETICSEARETKGTVTRCLQFVLWWWNWQWLHIHGYSYWICRWKFSKWIHLPFYLFFLVFLALWKWWDYY